ncbi:MAG TPA: MauE/DoxX family redox-associated membrane protein [Terriglobales bacterium]|nr:MauE/DoxX family redox-associated membrane protein [Terriglobales bacterium]
MTSARRISLWVMGVLLTIAGVMHFVRPDFYVPMMPDYLPWHLTLIYLSGIAEIICGVGLLIPQTRVYAAWATIALLIAIFPANIHIAVYNIKVFGAEQGAGGWNWLRLPLQGVLIWWAWLYTKPEAEELHGRWPQFESVFKPPLLERLDEVLQSDKLHEVVRDLRDDRVANLIDIGIRYQIITNAEGEEECLRQGWLDPVNGWWRELGELEPILRRGLLRAGDMALRHKLPIESYWVIAGEGLRVAVAKGKRQINLLVISPTPPTAEGRRWPPPAPDILVLGADPKPAA